MKKLFYSTMLMIAGFTATAQVKVGSNPTTINAASVLEIESTNQGLLMPRIALSSTTTATLAGGAHVAGMTVYNTATANDVTPGYYYNDGNKWVRLATGGAVDVVNLGSGNHISSDAGTGGTGTSLPNGVSSIIGIGLNSLASITSAGANNIGIGAYTLNGTTSGIYNVAVGTNGLLRNTTGNYNVAIDGSLGSNTTGADNIGVGFNALQNETTGGDNVAIGGNAGYNITIGSNNIMIGNNTTSTSATASNQLNIGNWIYGNNGNIGIGTTTPAYQLDVTGDINASGNVRANAVVLTSDARLKTNITCLRSVMPQLMQLTGYSYNWKDSKMGSALQYGVLAQDVEKVFPTMVEQTNDHKAVNYIALIPVLIQAIKEQQAEIESLKKLIK